MKRTSKLLALLLSFVFVFALAVPAFAADTKKVTVLVTSDLHSNIYDYDYYSLKVSPMGMARVYSVIKEERAKNPNNLLIDNGDTIQGSPFAEYYLNNQDTIKNPVIKVMNVMGYDSMTLGNHEFNYGIPLVSKLESEADFPLLSANIYNLDGTNFITPYTVKEVDGVKIAILGLTTTGVTIWDKGNVEGKLAFNDVLEEGKKWVQIIKETEKPDAIIISAHSGLGSASGPAYEGQVKELANALPEVTAIIAGHSHTEIAGQTENGVLIVQPKRWGERVSAIDLEFEKEGDSYKIFKKEGRIISTANYENAPEVMEAAKEDIEAVDKAVNTIIGNATGEFPGEDQQIKNTALMDLIHDVQLKYGNADLSIAASFNASSRIPAGDIKEVSINGLYIYENFLNTTEMTGAQLKQYLEYCANYFQQSVAGDTEIKTNPEMPGYNYDMVKGIDYTLDITKPAGERLVDITYQGKAVSDDQIFKVAMNNYRFGGGGGHMSHIGLDNPKVLYDSQAELGDVGQLRSLIKEFIKEKGSISPVHDNNYHLVTALGSSSASTVSTASISEPQEENAYVVVKGDTLSKIAKEHNISWQELAKYNKLKNPNLIYPGQIIKLPAA